MGGLGLGLGDKEGLLSGPCEVRLTSLDFFCWIIYWCSFLDEVTLVHEMTSHLGGTHVQLSQSEMPLLTLDPCRGH